MSLRDKILKNSTIEETDLLQDSQFYNQKDVVKTSVPMINVALSGRIDGGMVPGATQIAGASKNFKTGFALFLAHSFLVKYPTGIILFYDSEFGAPQAYFNQYKIPLESVVHSPFTSIEQLRHDLINQLDGINRGEPVLIIVDSLGNAASNKEINDARSGSESADMTRAKVIKSLFRIIGPRLTMKNIPMVVLNHSYKTLELYAKEVPSGGTGSYYNSDNIWLIGRQQDKDGTEIAGYNFIINIEKSRYLKEKSKIPINVSFDTGLNKWSGLFPLAVEAGYIVTTKKGWYNLVDQETKQPIEPAMRADAMASNGQLWTNMLETTSFPEWIKNKYSLTTDESELLQEEK